MTAHADWRLHEPDPMAVAALSEALAIDPLLARLLCLRGHGQPQEAKRFLQPALRDLPDPLTMADAELAATCLAQAIAAGKKICVYGDYDVDGISATGLLWSYFQAIGYPVQTFLPDRFRDGYGLHGARLGELADGGVDLFISVDCGTNSVDEIAAMRARGLDFIVCDHHALGPERPPATALLNPQRTDCAYPDKQLSAVGVALVLCMALRRALHAQGHPGAQVELRPLLEFVALGTIADMVPLSGVNRIVAWHGLRQLGISQRPGVQALARQSDLYALGSDHIGFALGPRINAAGRVAEAKTAFELLTTQDPARAQILAEQVNVENNHRRELQMQVTQAALAQAQNCPERGDAVVVADLAWHQGVVGIVANRVKDDFRVPAFVLAVGEDGVARGSGRSVAGYDLVEGLRACHQGGLFERFGGHAFAAGVTIQADRLPLFRQRLAAHVAEVLPAKDRLETLEIDAELDFAAAGHELLSALDRLEPFGKGNPRPTFLLRNVQVHDLQVVGKDRAWVRCAFSLPGRQAVWARKTLAGFGAFSLLGEVVRGECVDAVIRLERNSFRGSVTVQATVQDVAPAGTRVAAVVRASGPSRAESL